MIEDNKTYLYIKAGTYMEYIVIPSNTTVAMIGDSMMSSIVSGIDDSKMSSIEPGTPADSTTYPKGKPAITIKDGSTVTIQGIKLTGSTGGTKADGIMCSTNGNRPTLFVLESLITSNDGLGINSDECDVTLRRNWIEKNQEGGVDLSTGDFELVNNLVVDNGNSSSSTSMVGGIQIVNATSFKGSHNTVTGNTSSKVSGVKCDDVANIYYNSIVYKNVSSGDQYAGCTFNHSDVEGHLPGNGILNIDPIFDTSYKPTAAVLKDKGDKNNANTHIDLEGTLRLQSSDDNVDIGAFEIK
jgi:hypothetical protein